MKEQKQISKNKLLRIAGLAWMLMQWTLEFFHLLIAALR